MKLKSMKNCKAQFRNFGSEYDNFDLRVKYENSQIILEVFNPHTLQYELCLSFETVIDFEGHFLIAANSGIKNPDYHFLKSFKVYNTSVPYDHSQPLV